MKQVEIDAKTREDALQSEVQDLQIKLTELEQLRASEVAGLQDELLAVQTEFSEFIDHYES